MIRTAASRPTALLLVLSVLLMGAGLRAHACSGTCCAMEQPAGHASSKEAKRFANPHACCCDSAPLPCDLERAPAPDLPDSALGAALRVDAPAAAPAVIAPVGFGSVGKETATTGRLRPSAQGPPGPVYLRTQSFLC